MRLWILAALVGARLDCLHSLATFHQIKSVCDQSTTLSFRINALLNRAHNGLCQFPSCFKLYLAVFDLEKPTQNKGHRIHAILILPCVMSPK